MKSNYGETLPESHCQTLFSFQLAVIQEMFRLKVMSAIEETPLSME